jgi:rhodanese-related sulfurtransferase
MPTSVADLVAEAIANVENLSPAQASTEIAAGGVVVLDVREPVEWEAHIAGAIQVPRGVLEFVADPSSPRHREELNPASRIVVYCRSGHRAALATSSLKAMGFENVANLDGGLAGWKAAGLPTVEHHEGL